MSSRALKKEVAALLEEHELSSVLQRLSSLPAKGVINSLFPALCREVPQTRWFAVSSMGETVARLAESDMEEARIIMRRFLWSLNDESGGIGWGAPEAMAEIMSVCRPLAEEYSHMLVSYLREDGDEPWQDGNYLEHVLLQRGLLWGIGRLSLAHTGLMQEKLMPEDLAPFLDSVDSEVRAMAAWAAGNLGFESLNERLRAMTGEKSPVTLYLNGDFEQTSVGELAQVALRKMVIYG